MAVSNFPSLHDLRFFKDSFHSLKRYYLDFSRSFKVLRLF